MRYDLTQGCWTRQSDLRRGLEDRIHVAFCKAEVFQIQGRAIASALTNWVGLRKQVSPCSISID